MTQYFGDIFQYRLAFQHFLDDRQGLAYAVEVLGLNGLPFRLDGRQVNTKPGRFGLVGVQPTLEYQFTDQIVGSAGCSLPWPARMTSPRDLPKLFNLLLLEPQW